MSYRYVDKSCEVCGVLMTHVGVNRRFCKACKETGRGRARLAKPLPAGVQSIDEVIKAARDAGMSYGQYVNAKGV